MRRLSYLFAAGLLILSTASAQNVIEHKMQASDGQSEDWFGSVAMDKGVAIVGARLDDDNGANSGSAYVFVKDSGGWSQTQKLLASDGTADDRFGRAVAISGDYAIVGAHYKGNRAGAAYIFMNNGSAWTQQAELTASDADSNNYFGISVGLSGDYAIVGSFGNGDSSGAAYIFMRTGTVWTQQAKLIPSEADTLDRFGRSVSISGDYALIGSYGDDDLGPSSGSAYIFQRNGATWIQVAKLTASDGAANDHFGFSTAIAGDYAIIGAHSAGPNNTGASYVFKRDTTVWSQVAELTASDADSGEEFGVSVGITPGEVIVGAWMDGDNGPAAGSAYLFKEDDYGWTQYVKLVPSDPDSGNQFGRDVAIAGTDAIVGSIFANGVSHRTGAAYVFEDVTLGVRDPGSIVIPASIRLEQNYPNPFNPSTSIRYSLNQAAHVELTIHNLLGQEIRTLVDGFESAGNHEVSWDGTNNKSEGVAGGMYLIRLKSGSTVTSRKMMLLK